MKIVKSFGDTNANSLADLGMATVELAVVSQAGKSLAKGCYIFEGDDSNIFCFHYFYFYFIFKS